MVKIKLLNIHWTSFSQTNVFPNFYFFSKEKKESRTILSLQICFTKIEETLCVYIHKYIDENVKLGKQERATHVMT